MDNCMFKKDYETIKKEIEEAYDIKLIDSTLEALNASFKNCTEKYEQHIEELEQAYDIDSITETLFDCCDSINNGEAVTEEQEEARKKSKEYIELKNIAHRFYGIDSISSIILALKGRRKDYEDAIAELDEIYAKKGLN